MPPSAEAGPDEDRVLMRAFKTLGEPRRFRLLRILLEVPDTLCGCELSDILGVPDYQVSRDLRALRLAGLVRDRGRTGTWVHYEAARGAGGPLDAVLGLVNGAPIASADSQRLALRYGLREQVGCVLGAAHPDVVAAFDAADLD